MAEPVNLSSEASLPVPLIATLAMTTLLPSLPILKRVDSWLLSNSQLGRYLSRGTVADGEDGPRGLYCDQNGCRGASRILRGRYGDTFTEHLREEATGGLKRSEYRFT
jgi:hypothetical protein